MAETWRRRIKLRMRQKDLLGTPYACLRILKRYSAAPPVILGNCLDSVQCLEVVIIGSTSKFA
jgi:hypothetical protein